MPLCRFYNPAIASSCRNGDSCPFQHIDPQDIKRTAINSASSYPSQYVTTPNLKIHVKGPGRTVNIDPKYRYVAPALARTSVDSIKSNAPEPISTSTPKEATIKKPEAQQPKIVQATIKPYQRRSGSTSTEPAKLVPEEDDLNYVYSAEGKLSAADLKEYESAEFTNYIPIAPPPKSLA